MLSVREFCTALYLMERFREGRPLPPSLPPGIHFDDPRGPEGPMPAAQRPGYGGSNWQQQGNNSRFASLCLLN
jgi:epidermal growth factor receptor substrate 15